MRLEQHAERNAVGEVSDDGHDRGQVDPVDAYGRLNRVDDRPRVRLNGEAEQRPIIITAASAGTRDRARAAQVADLIIAGNDQVALTVARRVLGERGHDNVLAEGGPGVAAQLASADLIDELCITVSPVLTGGDASRILNGHPIEPPTGFEPHQVLESEGFLFVRYRRR